MRHHAQVPAGPAHGDIVYLSLYLYAYALAGKHPPAAVTLGTLLGKQTDGALALSLPGHFHQAQPGYREYAYLAWKQKTHG